MNTDGLYIFFFNLHYNKKNKTYTVVCEKCQVKESGHSYIATKKFPEFFKGGKSKLSKQYLNKVHPKSKFVVILENNDKAMAKKIFADFFQEKIDKVEKKLPEVKRLVKILRSGTDAY